MQEVEQIWQDALRASPNTDAIGDGVAILQHELLFADFLDHALQHQQVLDVQRHEPLHPCQSPLGT